MPSVSVSGWSWMTLRDRFRSWAGAHHATVETWLENALDTVVYTTGIKSRNKTDIRRGAESNCIRKRNGEEGDGERAMIQQSLDGNQEINRVAGYIRNIRTIRRWESKEKRNKKAEKYLGEKKKQHWKGGNWHEKIRRQSQTTVRVVFFLLI